MKYLIFILTIVAPCCLEAQDFIAGEATYSSYSMKDLKRFHSQTVMSISPALRTVTSFPSYFGWGVNGGYEFSETFAAGISFRYTSTGARSNIKDYSGEVNFDQLVQSWSAGAFMRKRIFNANKLDGYFGTNVYYVRTADDIVTTVTSTTPAQSATDRLRFTGDGFGFVPSVQLFYHITDNIFIYASGGYELQLQKKMKYQRQETDLHAEWDGMRLAFGIGYRTSRNKPSDK